MRIYWKYLAEYFFAVAVSYLHYSCVSFLSIVPFKLSVGLYGHKFVSETRNI